MSSVVFIKTVYQALLINGTKFIIYANESSWELDITHANLFLKTIYRPSFRPRPSNFTTRCNFTTRTSHCIFFIFNTCFKGVLHPWALFLKTLSIFSKNTATSDKVSYGSGQKCSKELKKSQFYFSRDHCCEVTVKNV